MSRTVPAAYSWARIIALNRRNKWDRAMQLFNLMAQKVLIKKKIHFSPRPETKVLIFNWISIKNTCRRLKYNVIINENCPFVACWRLSRIEREQWKTHDWWIMVRFRIESGCESVAECLDGEFPNWFSIALAAIDTDSEWGIEEMANTTMAQEIELQYNDWNRIRIERKLSNNG